MSDVHADTPLNMEWIVNLPEHPDDALIVPGMCARGPDASSVDRILEHANMRKVNTRVHPPPTAQTHMLPSPTTHCQPPSGPQVTFVLIYSGYGRS